MRSSQKISLLIVLIIIFSSCQTGTLVNQSLSKMETRIEIMNRIADDSTMANEMIVIMRKSQNGNKMIQQHQSMMMRVNNSMTDMMKDNPVMMHSIMMNMMETYKHDTTIMHGMYKAMMENKEMMDTMQNMRNEKGM